MSVKYNMQPSDWPVCCDLVMTSPYDNVIIHKLQYVCHHLIGRAYRRGRGADKPSRSGARRKKRKINRKRRKIKMHRKRKAKQIQNSVWPLQGGNAVGVCV